MHWKNIDFKLEDGFNRIVLRGNVPAGNILTIGETGVRACAAVGPSFGFYTANGRVKFFRGTVNTSLLSSSHDKIDESVLNGITFALWINKDTEQMVINSCGYNLLLVNKSGVYRFNGINGELVGLPVDSEGRLLVLR